MTTRQEVIDYCLTFPDVYEDYPFHDDNWTVMRCRQNTRAMACIFERQGHMWVNVKCRPEAREGWRGMYAAIQPAYHMNKEHWLSIVLDGSVPPEDVGLLLTESHRLVALKKR